MIKSYRLGTGGGSGTSGTTAHANAQSFAEGSNPSLQSDLAGNLKVSVLAGEIEEHVWIDDFGVQFVYRDVGGPGSPNFIAYRVPSGQVYMPQGNPRYETIDNIRGNFTFDKNYNISVQYAAIATAGSGYAYDDLITLAGGTNNGNPAIARVTKVNSSGGILAVSFASVKGASIGGYSAAPTNPVAQASTTGSGTGATFTITTATQIAAMVDGTGMGAVQLASTFGDYSATVQMQGSVDEGKTWQVISWTYGSSNAIATGSPSAPLGSALALINAPPPLLRMVIGSGNSVNPFVTSWSLREAPLEPTTQTVGQGVNNGSNNYWYVTQQATNYGPPRFQAAVISAATTNATFISSSAKLVYNITLDNNTSTDAYLKIFNKSSTPVPGTDTPVAVYRLRANSTFTYSSEGMGTQFAGGNSSVGLGYALTANAALTDNTAIAAGAIVGTIVYD